MRFRLSFILVLCTALAACGGAGAPESDTVAPIATAPPPDGGIAPGGIAPPAPAAAATPASVTVPPAAPPAVTAPSPPGAGPSAVAGGQRWSDPATWGGNLPPAQSVVVIPAGKTVVLDGATPALRGLVVRGRLVAGDRDLAITADYIHIEGGLLQIGTAAQPFLHRAILTLTGQTTADTPATPGFGSKVLSLMGGTLQLHGRPVTRTWTRLDGGDLPLGARTLQVSDATGWRPGDQIVISSSTGRQGDHSLATIASIDGNTIGLREGTRAAHIGRRHTVGDRTFDFRSEVGLLTHNIVVQGDAGSQASRIGGHAMFMAGASGATVQIAHAQFQHMGQFDRLGRYPIHFHLMGQGCRDCYVQNATVRDTLQRGIVVHDTSQVRVAGNVVFNTVGHNIVVETPTTGDNRIEGNLALVNDMPRPDFTQPELALQNDHLPGNYWFKSARNTFIGNVAAGSLSNGFIFDAVNTGPVVFRGNVGRNSEAQGRVGAFNFGSGILILFNRLTDPQDEWVDNTVFHNQVGFWPENEPDEDAQGQSLQRQDSGFVVRGLVAVENAQNVVNRGVGQRVHYVDPVLGGGITRAGRNGGFMNQYGSELRIVNPTFVNVESLNTATDIAVPQQSRFFFRSGGRFIGPRSLGLDQGSISTFEDDALLPRGTYIAPEQTAYLTADCSAVRLGEEWTMRCATDRTVGELDLRMGATSTATVHATQPILRSDGLSYVTASRPGSNQVNGLHGYAVLLNRGLHYSVPVASAAGYALRLDLHNETFLGGLDEATATVDVSVPLGAAPRAVLLGASTRHPVTAGTTALRPASSTSDWHANPLSTYLYDPSGRRLWIKASHRWLLVQP